MKEIYPLTLEIIRGLWHKHTIDLESLTRDEISALLRFAEARLVSSERLTSRPALHNYQWPQDRSCDDDAHPYGGPL